MTEPVRLSRVAELTGGTLDGEDVTVSGLASVDFAGPGDLVFAESQTYATRASSGPCAAVIAPPGVTLAKPCIRCSNPRQAFLGLLHVWAKPMPGPEGVHPDAVVSEQALIDPTVSLGAGVVVEAGASVGPRTRIFSNAYIGAGCTIGADCVILPGVSILHDVQIGNQVVIGPNSVIGGDGFGYAWADGRHHKIPHVGTVVIEDDVELGACVCVDRAKTGATRIGTGTRCDNLVHIAHNVQVGPYCLLVAQVGVAGSSRLGAGVVLAGQVGVKDNVTIGDGATLAAKSAVIGNLAPGGTYLGYPAQDIRQEWRERAYVRQLHKLFERVKALEAEVSRLSGE